MMQLVRLGFLALIVGAVTVAQAGRVSAMAPEASVQCSATTPALAAPGNLRVIRGLADLGEDDLLDQEVPSGPHASVEDENFEPAPVSLGSHDYFLQLAQRPDCQAAYSLRSSAEIDKYRYGLGTYAVKVSYDGTIDAAKWQWVKDDLSAEQLRLPISLDHPVTGTRRVLIISDHRWDASWFTEFKDATGRFIGGWKWLQVTSGAGSTNPKQRIWFEPQMRGIGDNAFSTAVPPVLSLFGAREYLGVRAPTTPTASVCGISFGESIGPMLNCFKAYPNTWTRTWIQIEETAGDTYAKISWWMADENQNPVPILLNAELLCYNPHTEFWIEYNTSADTRVGGPMAAWARNVVVLKDVADPSTTFARPVK